MRTYQGTKYEAPTKPLPAPPFGLNEQTTLVEISAKFGTKIKLPSRQPGTGGTHWLVRVASLSGQACSPAFYVSLLYTSAASAFTKVLHMCSFFYESTERKYSLVRVDLKRALLRVTYIDARSVFS